MRYPVMPPLNAGNFAARNGRVSASEVAALMPEGHPYLSALDVYHRIAGNVLWVPPNSITNFSMTLGTILEPAILKAAAVKWGWRVIANGHTYIHPTAPLCATPDARIVGEKALVEVKYSGNPPMWVNLPPYVYWQVQAQMMCSGTQRVEVVVLAGGLRRFTVDRNRVAGRRIAQACHEMLDRIEKESPPEVQIEKPRFVIDITESNIPQSMIGV